MREHSAAGTAVGVERLRRRRGAWDDLCVESYIGEQGGSEGVKPEQQVLITDDGNELISTFPFEAALLTTPS